MPRSSDLVEASFVWREHTEPPLPAAVVVAVVVVAPGESG